MERKTLQVLKSVHTVIQEVKEKRAFKSDSETIAYLVALYEDQQNTITLVQHEAALKRKDEILNNE